MTDKSINYENAARGSSLPDALPTQEKEQPDPFLQMSTAEQVGASGFTVFAIAIVVILGVVFYGLNGPARGDKTAPPSSPVAAGNAGAPAPAAPQATNKAG